MSRTYRPAIAYPDGTNEFVLENPIFRPVLRFEPSLGRRHHPNTIARRDGARSYLPGKLDIQRIMVEGSFGGGATEVTDTSRAEGMRDIFIGHFMQKDDTFRLYRYADRYAIARLISADFPMERQINDLEQDYRFKFDLYDPHWYDTSGDQSVCGTFVLNSECVVFTIGGNAPTPVEIDFTIPADCSCVIELLHVEDIGLDARTGKGYFEIGDGTCFVCDGLWNWNPGDEYHTITGPSDCTAPLEAFAGYFFHSGPGDVTICFTTPDQPIIDCTVNYCFTWHDRWYNP